jgi:ParB-like chromosome segregation protein Spo0J
MATRRSAEKAPPPPAAAAALAPPEQVPVGELVPYPGNARVHNLAAIAESLRVNGQYRALVAQRSTRHVLVGNGTLQAATELGWATVAVAWLDVDDMTARRIVLADNRASDLATYDERALVALLQPMAAEDLAGTAFSIDDLDDLLAHLGALPVTEPQLFEGDFGEPRSATEQRRNAGVAMASEGYKEVVLVLKAEELEGFRTHVAKLQEAWGTDSTSSTVARALEQCATL